MYGKKELQEMTFIINLATSVIPGVWRIGDGDGEESQYELYLDLPKLPGFFVIAINIDYAGSTEISAENICSKNIIKYKEASRKSKIYTNLLEHLEDIKQNLQHWKTSLLEDTTTVLSCTPIEEG
jgi:hypothetical protein